MYVYTYTLKYFNISLIFSLHIEHIEQNFIKFD